jgi:hypothetical protein
MMNSEDLQVVALEKVAGEHQNILPILLELVA